MMFSACGLTSSTTSGPITIQLFFHSGQEPEREALNATLKAFSDRNPGITVDAVQLPEGRYTDQVNIAALAHSLPCLLDFDGPTLYNYAWSGYLIPLDKYVSPEMKADFLPSIIKQGTYNHHLYSLGQFDSGLGLYANKQYLSKVGVRIPTIDNPWTLSEFNDVLAKLKNVPGVKYPLDLQMSAGSEWFTYGFSPFVESFGGDLINRSTYQSASGVLNGPEAVAAMTWFQGLFKQGYSNPWPVDATDFPSGRSALSWAGHWVYPDYSKALGDNLLVLPARKSVIARSRLYAPNGPLYVFVQQLQRGIAEPRPITPAYPTITSAFIVAVSNIAAGADVKEELDKVVQEVDQDIKDNQGYPPR